MSGPVGVGGFEEGEFEGDGPLEKVVAQILLRGADAVQLRAQEIDEAAKPRIVVQRVERVNDFDTAGGRSLGSEFWFL
jgi:hypothetical protein